MEDNNNIDKYINMNDKVYPSNDIIMKTIDEIVMHNVHNGGRTKHMREVLENICTELCNYLETIAEISDYEEKNLLNR